MNRLYHLSRPVSFLASITTRAMATTATGEGRLAGKVAIVTASTDGIGFAIAQRLGQEGAKVVVSSRKPANVERAVADLQGIGCTVVGIPCHVSKQQERQSLIDKTVEKFGGLDILVSNAAVNPAVGGVLDVSVVLQVAEPKEMGGLVAFLCSDDASYITGESYVAAGGMLSRL
ncbi:Dehydrogenase/reductase SDR family member 4 [Portunus trituberculatus]|uniref:Dehydrogenase/reductase SDR family member 4 n=1 Tax=Portunus trituberculatus TaxID=210409 RepID=A0A5B7DAJ7_PORTR|nr:Dehydrogenase/reductase SDR family member 4 [Portunus trituberculatus]